MQTVHFAYNIDTLLQLSILCEIASQVLSGLTWRRSGMGVVFTCMIRNASRVLSRRELAADVRTFTGSPSSLSH